MLMRAYPPPRRKTGEGIAPTLSARPSGGGGLGTNFDCDGGLVAYGQNRTSGPVDVAGALSAAGSNGTRLSFENDTFITHRLCAGGHGASEDGTGRGIPLVTAFDCKASSRNGFGVGESSPTLLSMAHRAGNSNGGGHVAVFQPRIGRNGRGYSEGFAPALSGSDAGATSDMRPCIASDGLVRRLTPRECERLQGFPDDDYTLIPYRGKPATDSPRYKALGNSMAVPVMRWIGERIQMCESVSCSAEPASATWNGAARRSGERLKP